MGDQVLMPKALTAENGAKGLLLGEFKVNVDMVCTSCYNDAPDFDCETCGGDINFTQKVTIDWRTIKEIYAMAVKHLGKEQSTKETAECVVLPDETLRCILGDAKSMSAKLNRPKSVLGEDKYQRKYGSWMVYNSMIADLYVNNKITRNEYQLAHRELDIYFPEAF